MPAPPTLQTAIGAIFSKLLRLLGRRRIHDTIFLMFIGVEHTAIASPDPAKLAQWYVDHLGFHINFAYVGNYFVKAANGSILEIIPSEGSGEPQNMADNKKPGIRHLAIAVDDFESAHAHLKSQNVHFLGEPFDLGTNRLVFFNDGDGNLVHLIRRETPLP
jgi:glyoxylase I family protein